MSEIRATPSSRVQKAIAFFAWILVGVAIAAAVTALFSPLIGPPYISYHNAHSPGKIPAGDAWLQGAAIMGMVTAFSGLILAIAMRKKRIARNIFIGIASSGVITLLAFFLLFLMIAKILSD